MEYLLGTIAVMHIEIRNCDAPQAMGCHRMRRADRDIVENTKSHRTGAFCMMAGRADVAKSILDFFIHHQVHSQHHGARRPKRGLVTVRIHCGVGIDMNEPLRR